MGRSVHIHRVYEHTDAPDGFRVFVDRLWPRGISKRDFTFDLWCKDLAPSPSLRQWFGHKVQNWPGFQDRYRAELNTPEQHERIREVLRQADGRPIILLYGARDPDHNHAVILAQEFERVRDLPGCVDEEK